MADATKIEALLTRPIPARAGAAATVLALTDDPDSSMADVVNAVGSDPALAARVLTLANSAYYGLSRRVGTLQYAISVIGFQTLRALAVPICAGLDGPNAVPSGFWEQSASAATAAYLLAPVMGASPPDAFCAGLLHTLGSAMLHQEQPLPQLCLPMPTDENDFNGAELARYGMSHAEAGARTLASWRFPEHLCALVAWHHDVPLPDAAPLVRTLHAARIITDLYLAPNPDRIRATSSLLRLSDGELVESRIDPLVERVGQQSEALLAGLRA